MRVVLDTTILVRSNDSSTGLARQLLLTLLKVGHTLVVSSEMLHEAAKVLRYPRFQKFLEHFGISVMSDVQLIHHIRSLAS